MRYTLPTILIAVLSMSKKMYLI